MTREELVELLTMERFGAPVERPAPAIHHTPLVRAETVAEVIDLTHRRRQRDQSRHRAQRTGRVVVRRRVG